MALLLLYRSWWCFVYLVDRVASYLGCGYGVGFGAYPIGWFLCLFFGFDFGGEPGDEVFVGSVVFAVCED